MATLEVDTNRYSGRAWPLSLRNVIEKLVSSYGLEPLLRARLTDAKAELLMRAEKLMNKTEDLYQELINEIASGRLLENIPGVRDKVIKLNSDRQTKLKSAKQDRAKAKELYARANLAQSSTNTKFVENIQKDVAKAGGYKDYYNPGIVTETNSQPKDLTWAKRKELRHEYKK